jgi:prophage regulatory protein
MPTKSKKNLPNVKRCPTCGQHIQPTGEQIAATLGQLPPRSFVRAKLLLALLPFSEATLWRKVGNGTFPKPVKLSERVTGWRIEQVHRWMCDKGLIREEDCHAAPGGRAGLAWPEAEH